MSGASNAISSPAKILVRLLIVVAGAFVLVTLAPSAARALDLGDATGAVGDAVTDVTSATDGPVAAVTGTVGGTTDTVTGAADDTVGTTAGAVAGAVDQVVEGTTQVVDATTSLVDDTVEAVTAPVDQTVQMAGAPLDQVVLSATSSLDQTAGAVEPATEGLPGSSSLPGAPSPDPGEPPTQPAEPSGNHTEPHIPAGSATSQAGSEVSPVTSGDETTMTSAAAVGGSVPRSVPTLPTIPDRSPVDPASALMGGSPDSGGRGISSFAAFLAAAIALALGMRRWLRPYAVARAPNPFVSLIEQPG
jgi:hypothetical protein